MIGTKYFLKQARDEKYAGATFSFEGDAPPEAEAAIKELLAAAANMNNTHDGASLHTLNATLAKCRALGLVDKP